MGVAVAVAVSGGGVVAVAVAGLTKRFFDHTQKDFLINVWGYIILQKMVSTVVSQKKIHEGLRHSYLIHARDNIHLGARR